MSASRLREVSYYSILGVCPRRIITPPYDLFSPAEGNKAMIEIRQVGHDFGRARQKPVLRVLEGINLTIEDGIFVSFLGPSGCGKTTLLRIIDGLIRPTRGQIMVDGKVVQGPS